MVNFNILYFAKTINNEYASVGSNEITSSSYVKLLGVYFDQKLSYSGLLENANRLLMYTHP